MDMSFEEAKLAHPKLSLENSQETSDEDENYNCFAFAADDNEKWWSPLRYYYWPPNFKRELSLACFIEVWVTLLNYKLCGMDKEYEEDFEKVAIYCKIGTDEPEHMAKQLENGRWKSKLGEDIDIEHDLETLEDEFYGEVTIILKRKKNE